MTIRAFLSRWDKELDKPDALLEAVQAFEALDGFSIGYNNSVLYLLTVWKTADGCRWQRTRLHSEVLTVAEWTNVLQSAGNMGIIIELDAQP